MDPREPPQRGFVSVSASGEGNIQGVVERLAEDPEDGRVEKGGDETGDLLVTHRVQQRKKKGRKSNKGGKKTTKKRLEGGGERSTKGGIWTRELGLGDGVVAGRAKERSQADALLLGSNESGGEDEDGSQVQNVPLLSREYSRKSSTKLDLFNGGGRKANDCFIV